MVLWVFSLACWFEVQGPRPFLSFGAQEGSLKVRTKHVGALHPHCITAAKPCDCPLMRNREALWSTVIQDLAGLASTGWRLCCYTNRGVLKKEGCESIGREAVGEAAVDRCFVY